MALSASRARATLACAALVLAGCGTQYTDPIRLQAEPQPQADAGDPCAAWTTESDCRADTENVCAFQPNSVGCKASDPACPAGQCQSGDPFVRRSGESLTLHGSPYTFVGTVSWGIAWAPDDFCTVSALPDQEQAIVRTFDDLVEMRASVLKIWAFQSYAGAGGTDYSSFERVVAAARRAGVRLIFVLENHWDDCTRGGTRDDAFYQSGFQAPYGGYALSLSDYAARLVTHFRDEPTILAWEVMHEARGDDFSAFDAFAQRMSSTIREIDPNHLIALGLDNGDSPATSREGTPSNYERLHAHPAVDLMDVHDFFEPDVVLNQTMVDVRGIARTLQKVAYAGATAVTLEDQTSAAFSQRASRVELKLEAAMEAGYRGFLVYDYVPDWENPGTPFDARAGEPLAGPDGVIARHAPEPR